MKVLNEKHNYKGFDFNIVHLQAHEKPTKVLFVFPGAGYNFLGPLMYYPTHAILEAGGTIITADYDFRFAREDYPIAKEEILKDCMSHCFKYASQHFPEIEEKIFLGKSIGTQALCFLEEVAAQEKFSLEKSKLIWLTPVFKFEGCLEKMCEVNQQSLFLIGDKDPHFSMEAVENVQMSKRSKVKVFPGADHSMDIGNNLEATMNCHQEVTREIVKFLKADPS